MWRLPDGYILVFVHMDCFLGHTVTLSDKHRLLFGEPHIPVPPASQQYPGLVLIYIAT